MFNILNKILLRRFFTFDRPQLKLNEIQNQSLVEFERKVKQETYSFEYTSCLCGNSEGIILTERDRYCLPVRTYLCTSCGTLRTSPRLDKPSLSAFYEKDYRSIYVGNPQAPDEFFEQQSIHGVSIRDFVWKTIKPDKDLIVFDVGCGAGGTLIPFKHLGCKVFGCDLGSQYLHRGISEGLTLEHGNIKTLYQYGKADLVILSHVIEHFPQPLETLKQISEGMSENGYLYIEVPGIFNIHNAYKDPLLYFQNAHLYHFTLSTLTFLLEQAGFQLVKGDNSVQALYQKTNTIPLHSPPKEWVSILFYLYFAEINHHFGFLRLLIQHPRYFLSKILRFLLGDSAVDRLKRRFSKI
ncbi:class I SAM-dependent methyltransferase [Umezakia sp. BLCC-F208]|jgi:SAM-dependent methyltransferase